MAATANLALPHIAEGQGRPDIQHNDGLDALDAAMTERLVVDLGGADGAVTPAQARAHLLVSVTGATVAGLALALPAVRRPFFVVADPANLESFSAVRGATAVSIAPGAGFLLFADGTADGLSVLLSGTGGTGVSQEYVDAAIAAAMATTEDEDGAQVALEVDLSAGDVALTEADYAAAASLYVIGVPATPARILDLPALSRTVTVVSDPDNAAAFTVRRGTAVRSLGRGAGMTVYTGAGNVLRLISVLRQTFRSLNDTPKGAYAAHAGQWLRLNAAGTRLEFVAPPPYRIGFFAGQGHEADEVLGRHDVTDPLTLPEGLAGSRASYGTAPTAAVTLTLKKNGTSFATVTFAAGETVGSFAAAVETSFAHGDVVTLHAPNGPDTTAKDLAVTLRGSAAG
jgi:hypothetical protein